VFLRKKKLEKHIKKYREDIRRTTMEKKQKMSL